jgi:outer membrane protein
MRSLMTVTSALALMLGVAGFAHASDVPDGKFMIRARMINVNPSNDGGSVSLGGKAKVGDDSVPEIDATYFFTPHIAAELIAATTTHKVNTVRGSSVDLGKVRLLPPTLTAQYHFDPLCNFKPYVGAGITYAHFYDSEHAPALGSVKYDDKFGVALQAGTDYRISKHVYLNADVKKIFVKTNVSVNNGATATAKANLNPWVVGAGVGYRF